MATGDYKLLKQNASGGYDEENLTPATAFNKAFGTAADTIAQGNDSRLSDARDWTASEVSQAEAEAGTGTITRKWTAQRVAQAIAALVVGGGLDLNELVKYQEGGWGASIGDPVSPYLSSWGILSMPNVVANSITRGVLNGEIAVWVKTSAISGNDAYIAIPYNSIKMDALPTFSCRFYFTDSNASILLGLSSHVPGSGYSINRPIIGLKILNSDSNFFFVTGYGSGTTLTDTGVVKSTGFLTLVVNVVSTAQVDFYLYDKEYTLLASATHTTNLPISTQAFYFTNEIVNTTGMVRTLYLLHSKIIIKS